MLLRYLTDEGFFEALPGEVGILDAFPPNVSATVCRELVSSLQECPQDFNQSLTTPDHIVWVQEVLGHALTLSDLTTARGSLDTYTAWLGRDAPSPVAANFATFGVSISKQLSRVFTLRTPSPTGEDSAKDKDSGRDDHHQHGMAGLILLCHRTLDLLSELVRTAAHPPEGQDLSELLDTTLRVLMGVADYFCSNAAFGISEETPEDDTTRSFREALTAHAVRAALTGCLVTDPAEAEGVWQRLATLVRKWTLRGGSITAIRQLGRLSLSLAECVVAGGSDAHVDWWPGQGESDLSETLSLGAEHARFAFLRVLALQGNPSDLEDSQLFYVAMLTIERVLAKFVAPSAPRLSQALTVLAPPRKAAGLPSATGGFFTADPTGAPPRPAKRGDAKGKAPPRPPSQASFPTALQLFGGPLLQATLTAQKGVGKRAGGTAVAAGMLCRLFGAPSSVWPEDKHTVACLMAVRAAALSKDSTVGGELLRNLPSLLERVLLADNVSKVLYAKSGILLSPFTRLCVSCLNACAKRAASPLAGPYALHGAVTSLASLLDPLLTLTSSLAGTQQGRRFADLTASVCKAVSNLVRSFSVDGLSVSYRAIQSEAKYSAVRAPLSVSLSAPKDAPVCSTLLYWCYSGLLSLVARFVQAEGAVGCDERQAAVLCLCDAVAGTEQYTVPIGRASSRHLDGDKTESDADASASDSHAEARREREKERERQRQSSQGGRDPKTKAKDKDQLFTLPGIGSFFSGLSVTVSVPLYDSSLPANARCTVVDVSSDRVAEACPSLPTNCAQAAVATLKSVLPSLSSLSPSLCRLVWLRVVGLTQRLACCLVQSQSLYRRALVGRTPVHVVLDMLGLLAAFPLALPIANRFYSSYKAANGDTSTLSALSDACSLQLSWASERGGEGELHGTGIPWSLAIYQLTEAVLGYAGPESTQVKKREKPQDAKAKTKGKDSHSLTASGKHAQSADASQPNDKSEAIAVVPTVCGAVKQGVIRYVEHLLNGASGRHVFGPLNPLTGVCSDTPTPSGPGLSFLLMGRVAVHCSSVPAERVRGVDVHQGVRLDLRDAVGAGQFVFRPVPATLSERRRRQAEKVRQRTHQSTVSYVPACDAPVPVHPAARWGLNQPMASVSVGDPLLEILRRHLVAAGDPKSRAAQSNLEPKAALPLGTSTDSQSQRSLLALVRRRLATDGAERACMKGGSCRMSPPLVPAPMLRAHPHAEASGSQGALTRVLLTAMGLLDVGLRSTGVAGGARSMMQLLDSPLPRLPLVPHCAGVALSDGDPRGPVETASRACRSVTGGCYTVSRTENLTPSLTRRTAFVPVSLGPVALVPVSECSVKDRPRLLQRSSAILIWHAGPRYVVSSVVSSHPRPRTSAPWVVVRPMPNNRVHVVDVILPDPASAPVGLVTGAVCPMSEVTRALVSQASADSARVLLSHRNRATDLKNKARGLAGTLASSMLSLELRVAE
ncbi:hypothetical protein KIPB_006559 [Kipferlia bialata]|uniref:Uncharacterized protein n=1 Tax=Kipferlia bialata TaxID=797122 RepID=A0A391NWP5_9EUKA|nr:hypothetical protein KIPB_006559 [Kipferlia bialata]|eukprot:g6559.t1